MFLEIEIIVNKIHLHCTLVGTVWPMESFQTRFE